jgi:hypothetical protein
MAYSDWLSEQTDPALRERGELIQVQLALEDEVRPAEERKRLRQQERKLLKARARTWLGDLALYLLDRGGAAEEEEDEDDDDLAIRCEYRLARGWLDSLSVRRLPFGLARLLARSQETRLLRELSIESAGGERPDDPGDDVIPPREYQVGLCPLVRAPSLGNVRVFRLGKDQGEDYRSFSCYLHTALVPDVVRQFPRLEELYLWANEYDLAVLFGLPTLGHLRILKVYHQDRPHPLEVLAANPALKRLTHLLFHPHYYKEEALGDPVEPEVQEADAYLNLEGVRALLRSPNLPALTHLQLRLCSMGDAGCEEVVRSGILKRLRSLDLRHGRITDEGARLLADCPDLGRLEYLNLERNGLTRAGIARLRAAGTKQLRVNDQLAAGEALSGQYLFEGDFE